MARVDERFIALLKQTEVDHAVNSLTRPQARDAYEFGRISGFLQGLKIAEELYLKALEDERNRE